MPLHALLHTRRAFLSAARGSAIRETNPKIVIETDLARAPVEPTMAITFLNDKQLNINLANMSVNQMFDEITRHSNALSREGLKSEREIQYLKDIDN